MRGYVNRAVVRMGEVPAVDETLTTASNTKEYTIPTAAVKGLFEVWLPQVSTASNEGWVRAHGWRSENGVLIFQNQPPASKTIKLVYMNPTPPRLAINTNIFSVFIPLNRVVEEALYLARVDRMDKKRDRDEAKIELLEARQRWPIARPPLRSKLLVMGGLARRDQFTTPDPP